MKLKECLSNKDLKNTTLEMIAMSIKLQYDFNMYEINRSKIEEMARIILDVGIKYDLNSTQLTNFFTYLKEGKYGTLYKMPSDLIDKFWKYTDSVRIKMP